MRTKTLNDLAHEMYAANSASTGTLADVTRAYLQQETTLSTNNIADLWFAQMELLGYSGKSYTDMQFEFWGAEGYTGTWNDRYYAWLLAGGTFPP